jgi:hypothetical protein
MTTAANAPEGPCRRCGQPRPLFPAQKTWGDVPSPLCPNCWSTYADARAAGSFVDFNDAFDNATDDQLQDALAGRPS